MPTEKLVQEILDKTPVTEILALRKEYEAKGFGPRTFVKGFHPEKQIRQKVEWAVGLGLHTYKEELFTLDIGTGAGWFPYILKCFGHTVYLSDVAEGTGAVAYERCIKILGMKKNYNIRVNKRQTCFSKGFPDNYLLFDFISATGIAFHENWNPLDWSFFVDDCFSSLQIGGRLFLQLNNTGKAEKGYEGFLQYLQFVDFKYESFDNLTWVLYKP